MSHPPFIPVPAKQPVLPCEGPTCIVVDLDDTLCHNTSGRGPYDWSRVVEDDMDTAVARVVWDRCADGDKLVVITGREEASRGPTEQWLDEHGISFDLLLMRATGDRRGNDEVKLELFNRHVRGAFNVRFWMDDAENVVAMVRNCLGVKCFQVEKNDYHFGDVPK